MRPGSENWRLRNPPTSQTEFHTPSIHLSFCADTGELRIERGQDFFQWWDQTSNPGVSETYSPADWISTHKPTVPLRIKLKLEPEIPSSRKKTSLLYTQIPWLLTKLVSLDYGGKYIILTYDHSRSMLVDVSCLPEDLEVSGNAGRPNSNIWQLEYLGLLYDKYSFNLLSKTTDSSNIL